MIRYALEELRSRGAPRVIGVADPICPVWISVCKFDDMPPDPLPVLLPPLLPVELLPELNRELLLLPLPELNNELLLLPLLPPPVDPPVLIPLNEPPDPPGVEPLRPPCACALVAQIPARRTKPEARTRKRRLNFIMHRLTG